jgi:Protein of unknown function (DUF3025)
LLPSIDWQRPWFAPYRELGGALARRVGAGAGVAQALNQVCSADAPRFVAPQAQGGEVYETFVARTNSVPTRDNLHDFFNGLVWLRYPALKRRVNLAHARDISAHGVTATRGTVRDRLTLFDENGALLDAPAELAQALRERDWARLFIDKRSLWAGATLIIVGHALLEKLTHPRKALTAHVWLGGAMPGADAVDPASPPFAPLPVLGVPGWWPDNEAPGFYADAAVFRPAGNLRSIGNARPCRS